VRSLAQSRKPDRKKCGTAETFLRQITAVSVRSGETPTHDAGKTRSVPVILEERDSSGQQGYSAWRIQFNSSQLGGYNVPRCDLPRHLLDPQLELGSSLGRTDEAAITAVWRARDVEPKLADLARSRDYLEGDTIPRILHPVIDA
jgi:hypothetical protein